MMHRMKDNNKFKQGQTHKQRQNVSQYENRTTEKQYKQPI